jgi:hypothetical protein
MNILFNLIFLFIFIYISLIIGVPGTNDNIIKNKLILFIGVFIYQFIVGFISKISKISKETKKHNIKEIFKTSIFTSLISIIGYSLYIDIILMNLIPNSSINNKFINSAIISVIITSTIGLSKIIELIINNDFI